MDTDHQSHIQASRTRHNYKLAFAVLIAIFAGMAALLAWQDFNASGLTYPSSSKYPPSSGGIYTGSSGILLTFPSQIQSVLVNEYPLAWYSSLLELNVSLQPSAAKFRCVHWSLGAFGNNLIRQGIHEGTLLKFVQNTREDAQQTPIETCAYPGTPGPITDHLSIGLRESPFRKSGYLTSIALPTIAFQTTSGNLKHWTVQSSISVPWAFAVSSGSPIAGDSSLGWKDSGPTPDQLSPLSLAFQPPTSPTHAATIVNLAAETSASKSLFIAGILAGVAGALIPWAGQLAIDSRNVKPSTGHANSDSIDQQDGDHHDHS